MVKNILQLFWKKLHNTFTIFSLATFCAGAAMFLIGTFLPNTQWYWVTPLFARLMCVLGFVLLSAAIIFFIIGILKTKSNEATPSFQFLFGIKKNLWQLYKLEQKLVELAGNKGLNPLKRDEILRTIRHDLKVTPIGIYKPLTEDETDRIVVRTNKKLGISRDKMTKKTINELTIIGIAVDKCGAGVSSLIEGNSEYNTLNTNLNTNRLKVRRDKKIKELKRLSYSLNTTFLTILYFEPIIEKMSPSTKIPHELMKEALDEEMQKQIETL